MINQNKYHRGDIWSVDFGNEPGSIQHKKRPAVIISNDDGNRFGPVVTVAAITTRPEKECKPWQVYFGGKEGRDQIILTEQTKVVLKSSLTDYLGRLDISTMKKLDIALAIEFDIPVNEDIKLGSKFLEILDKNMDDIITVKLGDEADRLDEYLAKIDEKIANANINISSESSVKSDVSKAYVDEQINSIKEHFNKVVESNEKIINMLLKLYEQNPSNNSNAGVNNEPLEIIINRPVKIVDSNNETHYVDTSKGMEKSNVETSIENSEDSDEKFINDLLGEESKKTTKRKNAATNGSFLYNKNISSYATKVKKSNNTPKDAAKDTSSSINCPEDVLNIINSCFTVKNGVQRIDRSKPTELKTFLEKCKEFDSKTMSNWCGITEKQLANRKYLIKKSLGEL